MLALDPKEYINTYGIDGFRLQIAAERCRRDLLEFIKIFWRVNDRNTPLVMGWPLEAICDHLMAVTDGHIKRLLINIPPGSMKSLAAAVFWPAWEWGPMERPWYRYICASYNQHLTKRDNRRFLRVCQDPDYFRLWGDGFFMEQTGQIQIINNRTGWKLATSVEGVGTGERGNRIIIDDANNPRDVESDVVREGVQFWIKEVMPDRLNSLEDDVIVCIQQRTHEHDATGTLLELAGLDYVHLCIPAEYDSGRHCITVLKRDEEGAPVRTWEDPRGLDDAGQRLDGHIIKWQERAVGPTPICIGVSPGSPAQQADGELYWPDRISRGKLREMQIAKGPFAYSGQYQQAPAPRGGGIIRREWWKLWEKPDFPDFIMVCGSLDTAFKEKEENDYNALTIWGIFLGEQGEPLVMLVNAWRDRCDLATLAEKVGNLLIKHKADYLLIEDKARGHDTAGELRRQFGSRRWSTRLLDPHKLGGDKVARLTASQPMFSGDAAEQLGPDGKPNGTTIWLGGLVWAPDKQYAEDVMGEVERFPKGAHDDFVDTVSMFFQWARKYGEVRRLVEHLEQQNSANQYKKRRSVLYDV